MTTSDRDDAVDPPALMDTARQAVARSFRLAAAISERRAREAGRRDIEVRRGRGSFAVIGEDRLIARAGGPWQQ